MTRTGQQALTPGPTPLYYQLEQALRERIRAGEFENGQPLPTEERLCEHYSVSRITVRKALDALIADGLITKRRGVGTFVVPVARGVRSVRLSGSLDEFLASAGALAVNVLSIERFDPPAEVVRGLQLEEGESVIKVELLSYLDGAAVGFFEIFLPHAIGDYIKPDDIGKGLPVIRMIEQKLGVQVVRAEQFIEPDIAADELAKHLGIEPNKPVLKVTRVYYDLTGRPIEMIIVRHHPEQYRYTVDFIARPRPV